MTTYALYLESGPKRRKTMVHVPALLGCVAVGPTTDEAIAATPDAIRAYRRFLRRHGEAADPEVPFHVEVAAWVTTRADADLDAEPDGGGRTVRAILLHILATPGAYLAAALGGAQGFSALQTAAERGSVPLAEALRRVPAMVEARVAAAAPGQRTGVVHRPKDVRTLTKAIRRTLEHDWEHRAELARRPGGPAI
jgi:predicted RNase H-like HicB family nuclease